jgi:hypothetical protein
VRYCAGTASGVQRRPNPIRYDKLDRPRRAAGTRCKPAAGSDAHHGAAKLRGRLNALGEPLRFGIPRGGADAVVARHGLTLVSDLGPHELADRHLRRSNGAIAGRPYGFAAIAHARAGLRTAPPSAVVAHPRFSLASRAGVSG